VQHQRAIIADTAKRTNFDDPIRAQYHDHDLPTTSEKVSISSGVSGVRAMDFRRSMCFDEADFLAVVDRQYGRGSWRPLGRVRGAGRARVVGR
jgi:hypothetical protein